MEDCGILEGVAEESKGGEVRFGKVETKGRVVPGIKFAVALELYLAT